MLLPVMLMNVCKVEVGVGCVGVRDMMVAFGGEVV